MKQMLAVSITICFALLPGVAEPQELDLNSRDSLKLVTTKHDATDFWVSVEVHNDQDLAGLDIPLRFAEKSGPVNLIRVEWSDRVLNWDFKHAAIDSTNKTVILGLIAELGGTRPDPYLPPFTVGDPSIATLVFRVEGDHRPTLTTFTTAEPHHALTFIYNRLEDSVLTVREFTPAFHVSEVEE